MHEHTHKEGVAETASGHDASRFDSHHAPVDMSGEDMSVRCAEAEAAQRRTQIRGYGVLTAKLKNQERPPR